MERCQRQNCEGNNVLTLFKQLTESRRRIKEIESKTLTLEIEARFADKKKEIE